MHVTGASHPYIIHPLISVLSTSPPPPPPPPRAPIRSAPCNVCTQISTPTCSCEGFSCCRQLFPLISPSGMATKKTSKTD